jgi:hypothetical protein
MVAGLEVGLTTACSGRRCAPPLMLNVVPPLRGRRDNAAVSGNPISSGRPSATLRDNQALETGGLWARAKTALTQRPPLTAALAAETHEYHRKGRITVESYYENSRNH